MLKKFSHIILSVLLLVSTMGVTISKHYCGDSFISTSVFTEAESCCGDSDCCHNDTSFYQLDEDYSLASISEIPFVAEVDLIGFSLLINPLDEVIIGENQTFIIMESPPPAKIQISLSKRQVYLL